MKRDVVVNIKGLLDIGHRITYSKDFGYSFFKSRSRGSSNGDIKITIVEDEEAQFINLFGVFVDLNTGNIALGLFPRANEYVCIGNVQKIIAKDWFGEKSLPENFDTKYIIELLKIDPLYYKDEIVNEVFYEFDSEDTLKDKYKSVSLYFVKDLYKSVGDPVFQHFIDVVNSGKLISRIASSLINVYLTQEHIAKDYFGNFITEMYDQDIDKFNGMDIEQVIKARDPNLESLTIRYLSGGELPAVFLNALKSYGFAVKDRKQIFNRTFPKNIKADGSYSDDEIIDIGIALSSMYYARSITKKEYVLAYNFMDMLRAVNWEQNILFALDFMTDYSSKVIWESLLKRFNIYDILKEQGLSEREFVLGVDVYKKSMLPQIDWGTCYKRYGSLNNYRMTSYSPTQIDNAGRVFEMTFQMVNKSLGI